MNAEGRKSWRFVAVAAILLLAATGFCLFEGGGHHRDSQTPDVCAGMIAIATAMMVLAVTALLLGSSVPMAPMVMVSLRSSVLDPPPKFASPS